MILDDQFFNKKLLFKVIILSLMFVHIFKIQLFISVIFFILPIYIIYCETYWAKKFDIFIYEWNWAKIIWARDTCTYNIYFSQLYVSIPKVFIFIRHFKWKKVKKSYKPNWNLKPIMLNFIYTESIKISPYVNDATAY